jgi:hypothetical protein
LKGDILKNLVAKLRQVASFVCTLLDAPLPAPTTFSLGLPALFSGPIRIKPFDECHPYLLTRYRLPQPVTVYELHS